jgi:4a-hydroxytetrahydrobiopterin dehydratase
MTDAEIDKLHPEVRDWKVIQGDDIKRLERQFKFKNFADALKFTNKVGQLAEAEDHHPSLLTEWGKVTVTWWTHKIKGLHSNDFIMAAKTDRLYEPRRQP